jgi:hypothetical protein
MMRLFAARRITGVVQVNFRSPQDRRIGDNFQLQIGSATAQFSIVLQ